MKILSFCTLCLFFGLSASAQEFGAKKEILVERDNNMFYIEKPQINASLSFLAPQINLRQFELREVDIFMKNQKREVNITAMMEKERRDKEQNLVELDSPMPTLSTGEKSIIQISNRIQQHNRGSNYDIYTGEKKIPAYREMRAGLFNGYYAPNVGGRFYSPYSPFLR